MHTEFTQSVLNQFKASGLKNPKVLCESENESDFGSANVTVTIHGLRLHIVNDRGVQSVEVGLSVDDKNNPALHSALIDFKDGTGQPTCPLEVLAVAKGWVSFNKLVEHYDLKGNRLNSFSEPKAVQPFYPLADALLFVADESKRAQLIEASKDYDLQIRAGDIEEELQNLLESLFSSPRCSGRTQ